MKQIWLSEYSSGVPRAIDSDNFSSCLELFENSVNKFRDRLAFANYERSMTYGELDMLTCQFAAYLQNELGIIKGERVAIMLPNVLQYPVSLFGIMRSGAITVNVNPQYTPRELQHQLNDSGAKVIIIIEQALPTLEAIIDETKIEQVIVTRMSDMLSTEAEISTNNKYLNFMKVMEDSKSLTLSPVTVSSDDTLFLQYTGGTTGLSKGAVLSHRNLVANTCQFKSWFANTLDEGSEIYFTPLPLYHIFALMVNCFGAVNQGALSVLITDPRDQQSVLDAFCRWRFTFMTGVNTLYNSLLNMDGFDQLSLEFKACVGGGAAVQKPIADKWLEVTGMHILEGYGLSETSPVLTMNKSDSSNYTGSIGLPFPSTDISLRDDAGNEVPLGEPGELCAKGPQVMSGYWNRDDTNKDSFTADGYFRTGDIATVDEKGYFRIVDRKKDMILVSGFNVFPNEIEGVVAGCDGVLENACIGVPNEKSGEAVKVFVVKKPGANISEDDITKYCKDKLTGYKVPKLIEFIDALPKSNVGKILRKDLRDKAVNNETEEHSTR